MSSVSTQLSLTRDEASKIVVDYHIGSAVTTNTQQHPWWAIDFVTPHKIHQCVIITGMSRLMYDTCLVRTKYVRASLQGSRLSLNIHLRSRM